MVASDSSSWFSRLLGQLPSKILWLFLVILLFGSFVLSSVWLLSVVIWPNQAQMLKEASLYDYVTMDVVRFRWPRVLLAGAQDVQVEVTCMSVKQYPLDIRLSLNSDAAHLDWVWQDSLEKTIQLSCSSSGPRTQWVTLRYTRILPSLFVMPETAFHAELVGRAAEKQLPLRVEGQGRWLIRQIGALEVSQRSPLILLVGLIVSAAASIYEMERRKKEEARQQSKRLLERFAAGEIDEAREEFEKADRALWNEADRRRFEDLLALAKGEFEEERYEILLKSNPQEVVQALLHSLKAESDQNPTTQRRLRLFPLDQVPLTLGSKVQEKIKEFGPLQGVEWPLEPQEEAESENSEFIDPWPVSRAEQELGRLFTSGAFYKTRLFEQLERGVYPGHWQCLYAKPGTGATTLGYALVQLSGKQTWAVRVTNISVNSSYPALAEQLLLYCSHNPLRLAELSVAQQRLLVDILASCLPKAVILAELDQQLQQTDPQESPKKARWKAGQVQLRWMIQTLHTTVGELDGGEWLHHFMRGLRCLGFHRFHLVLDLSQVQSVDLDRLAALRESFCGNDWAVTLIVNKPDFQCGEVIRLAWTEDELIALFGHRWNTLRSSDKYTDCIQENQLKLLVRGAKGSPRRLAESWKLWVGKNIGDGKG